MVNCNHINCLGSCFIRSPIFNNWIEHNKPEFSFVLCSPYLKKYAIERIIKEYSLSAPGCNIGIDILIRGKLKDFIDGSSDISALEALIRLRCLEINRVKRLTNLHMKAYLVDNKKLLLGSGNCTLNGLFANNLYGNVEGNICTKDQRLIKEFTQYYSIINKSAESLNDFYDKIVNEYNEYIDKNTVSNKVNELIDESIKKDETKSQFNFYYINQGKKHLNQKQKILGSEQISSYDVPQFSNFENGTFRLVEVLMNEGNTGVTFDQLGILLQGRKSDYANKKYGENHAKLAEMLDLVTITNDSPRLVYLNRLGEIFNDANTRRKIEILKTQIFRTPIVKDIISIMSQGPFNLLDYLEDFLATRTAERRRSNVKKLFTFLRDNGVPEINDIVNRLY